MTGRRLSPRAEADLEDIWTFTADRWGIDQAEIYTQSIFDAIDRLTGNPNLARDAGIARAGYRALPVGSHTIYMKADGRGGVLIVRVLHQRMAPDGQF